MLISFLIILVVTGLLIVAAKAQKKLAQEFDSLNIAEKVLRASEDGTSDLEQAAKQYSPLIMDKGELYVFPDRSAAVLSKAGWKVDRTTDAEDCLFTLKENNQLRDPSDETMELILIAKPNAVQVNKINLVVFEDGSSIYYNNRINYWMPDSG